jgi:type IV pilus assembly protein PilO
MSDAVNLPLSDRIQQWSEELRGQFSDLDMQDPGHWPPAPRYVLLAGVAAAVVVLSWFLWLGGAKDEFDSLRAKELELRNSFVQKLGKSAHLAVLLDQQQQVREYVQELERQLPDHTGMDALLAEVNRLGVSRGLQFELLRPGAEVLTPYYAELPISFRLAGRFHDVAAFAGDIARVPRIMHLHNLSMTGRPDGLLSVDGTLRVYRHLEKSELPDGSSNKAAKS